MQFPWKSIWCSISKVPKHDPFLGVGWGGGGGLDSCVGKILVLDSLVKGT
jgi:hypothetical protein